MLSCLKKPVDFLQPSKKKEKKHLRGKLGLIKTNVKGVLHITGLMENRVEGGIFRQSDSKGAHEKHTPRKTLSILDILLSSISRVSGV